MRQPPRLPDGVSDSDRDIRWGRWLAVAAVLYTAYTVALTWPLVLHMDDHLRTATLPGRLDLDLHLWTLAWISRTVVADPLNIFDANIFHPAPLTLAGSDHLLGVLPVAGPVYLMTGNPVATLNTVVLTSFPLAGLAAFALITVATRNPWAGLVGGLVYAFLPWRTRSFVPVQTFTIHYLPLALLGIGLFLRGGGRLSFAAASVFLALQFLSAYYLAYVALVAVAIALVVAAGYERPFIMRRWVGVAGCLALAGGFAAIVSIPYAIRQSTGGIPSYGSVVGSMFLTRWLGMGLVDPGEPVYLGVIPLTLALVGCFPSRNDPTYRTARIFFLALTISGYVLCLGSHVDIAGVRVPLPFSWLGAVVPGFSSMRTALRFITLTSLGLAGLGGIGVARVLRRLELRPVVGGMAAVVLLAFVMWDYRPRVWPMSLDPRETGDNLPEAYSWLAAHGDGGPLLEVPVGGPQNLVSRAREGRAMYFSTFHWLPLLNGYTGYAPPSHRVLMELARRLPEEESLQQLVNLVDLRWILLHRDRLLPALHARWEDPPGLAAAARFETATVFEVTQPRTADWSTQLLDPPADRTFAGLSTAPLPLDARRGRVEGVRIPGQLDGPFPVNALVRVVNLGDAPWPGLGLREDGLVVLEVSWNRLDGPTPQRRRVQRVRLPRDLAPDDSVTLRFPLVAPSHGRYRLTFSLVQRPDLAFPPEGARPLERTVEVGGPRKRTTGTRNVEK